MYVTKCNKLLLQPPPSPLILITSKTHLQLLELKYLFVDACLSSLLQLATFAGRKTDETGRSLTIRRYVTWRLKSVLIGRIRIQRTLKYHNIRIMNYLKSNQNKAFFGFSVQGWQCAKSFLCFFSLFYVACTGVQPHSLLQSSTCTKTRKNSKSIRYLYTKDCTNQVCSWCGGVEVKVGSFSK